MRRKSWVAPLKRWLGMVLLCGMGLQLYFVARIASMRYMDPVSTAFQRSEAWRLAHANERFHWQQQWVSAAAHPVSMKRAVIASEDDVFARHGGVQWDAIDKAWSRNARAIERAQARTQAQSGKPPVAKVIGGSTITQQLAKNLFLSGERTLLRKGQELLLTLALEQCLSKERILTIYLNSVEWGEGVFGVEAAAQHYFKHPAQHLNSLESARLAVMLPRPKYYEKFVRSPYLAGRAQTILGRMPQVELP